jgi:hypothetical protein
VSKLVESEREKLLHLPQELHKRVIGQVGQEARLNPWSRRQTNFALSIPSCSCDWLLL